MNYKILKKLRKKIRKIKNKERALALNKKMKEIISSASSEIERYKNLKAPMQDQKRVHINKHFVLTFKFDKKENIIIFTDFDHHNKIYNT
jgi:mRNA-degrading endonuclease RelE of RelBE toxin-antitoxin system